MEPSEEKATPPEISLRLFELSDVDGFMVWASDERVSRFGRWDTFTSRDDLLRYMVETVLPNPWFRAVCVGGRPVGAVCVDLNAGAGDQRCRGTLRYELAHEHWGRGIMSLVVKTVAASIFVEVPGFERLEAMAAAENRASQRVLEKAGFLREELLRECVIKEGRPIDLIRYSLLSTDRVPS